jgi:hypothetical protein
LFARFLPCPVAVERIIEHPGIILLRELTMDSAAFISPKETA